MRRRCTGQTGGWWFGYDAFGRRVRKAVVRVIPGKTFRDRREEVEAETAYVWDGDVLLHEIAPPGRQ